MKTENGHGQKVVLLRRTSLGTYNSLIDKMGAQWSFLHKNEIDLSFKILVRLSNAEV
jgi:hypothetical protein